MGEAYVVVHIDDEGVLTVFGNSYGNTLDHRQADALARRLAEQLGGTTHVCQVVAS